MEDIRKLATIRTVSNVTSIPNADNIETVTVGGWHVVTRKGEFSIGDRVVYLEIDSALPLDNPLFEFLEARGSKVLGDGKRYHVLRTARLRGQYSQGLVLPVSVVDMVPEDSIEEFLGVIKYELPDSVHGDAAGLFPTHIVKKTDAERVQNLVDVFGALKEHPGGWYATLKYDGTSVTYILEAGKDMRVASRNLELKYSTDLPQVKAAIAAGFDKLPGKHVVQAELFGNGIQTNAHKRNNTSIAVFNVYRLEDSIGVLVPRSQWPSECLARAVDILDVPFPGSVEEAISQAEGLKQPNSDRLAEGIVWHTCDGSVLPELGYRDCFKVINNKYLLKQ